MFFSRRVLILSFCLVLFLGLSVYSAFSSSNPLLGTWTVEKLQASDLITQVSIDRFKSIQPKEITFTAKAMTVKPHEGKENTVPVQYKEIRGDLWSFSLDDGKTWNEIAIQDKDTLIRTEKKQLDVVITYTLKRKQ